MNLSDPVTQVKNIGAGRAALLNKLGIETVEDLVLHFPRSYEDRSNVVNISEIMVGRIWTIKAAVRGKAVISRPVGRTLTRIRFGDETGEIDLVWFNQPYMKNAFKKDQEYIFTGMAREYMGRLTMDSPDYEAVGDKELLSSCRIVPVYHAANGITQKLFRGAIKYCIDNLTDGIKDFLPRDVIEAQGLCDREFAIRNIHFPQDDECFFVARKRLVFEELFLMRLSLMRMKGLIKKESRLVIGDTGDTEILKLLPYRLTAAQERVLGEIKADLSSGFVMNRLIQGDVGSGKTAVAAVAAYIVISSGYQAVMMAPTEVLAKQHLDTLAGLLGPLGIEVVLLTGSLNAAEKKEALHKIRSGEAGMIIGTHAVIQQNVIFGNLGLVIADEQHRFGVRQRTQLADKGRSPHVLIMTATPIPRTLALVLYGDMDISVIDQMPPGRKKIETYAVGTSYRERIYRFMAKEIAAGRQCYCICPAIEESEDGARAGEMQYVVEYARRLGDNLKGAGVQYLHGRMKPSDKQRVMEDFQSGGIDVLVSTTVIEVGVNVPNATVMLVENAERFGLAQLHQLRGRVGRGGDKSYCVLITDSKSQVCRERMRVMSETNDGFVISETDLELRGPGDFFGTRQHGLPEMRIANLYTDMEILERAGEAAMALYERDPELLMASNIPLEKEIENFLTV